MAGIGAESVVPLQANAGGLLAQAVSPVAPAVTPNSVSLLADAFRKGQISADDIIERYGNLAKTKEKAQIQNLDEFLHPEAIATRKQALDLMGEKQKSELATLPAETAAKEAQYQAAKLAAQRGDRAAVRAVAIKNGFGGQLSDDNDPQKDFAAYKNAVKYESAIKGANDIGKDVKRIPYEVTDEKGQVTVDPNKDTLASASSAINYTQEQAAKAHRLSMMTPEQFLAAGSPTVDEYVFGVEPKGAGESAAPGAVPVKDLVTPRKTTKTTTTAPDGTVTVKEETVDPTEHPNPDAASVTPAATQPQKPSLDVTGSAYIKKAAKAEPENAKMTEEAAKRVLTAEDFLDKTETALKVLNENPDVVGPGAFEGTGFGRGAAKTGAFLGIRSSREKTEAQNKLDMFLAGSVQATIKSLAGSGNRVMQAEIADETGLFNRAQPQLSSTPEVWKNWLEDVKKVYERSAAWERGTLSKEDSARLDKILGSSPSGTPAASTQPAGKSFTAGGVTFVEDPKNPGNYKVQQGPAAPAVLTPKPTASATPAAPAKNRLQPSLTGLFSGSGGF